MKALVTGGGGFLGQAIVRGLLERGAGVRSFSRKEHADIEGVARKEPMMPSNARKDPT